MSPQGNLCFLGGSLEEVRGNKKKTLFHNKGNNYQNKEAKYNERKSLPVIFQVEGEGLEYFQIGSCIFAWRLPQ
jgi:hypothetical protein